MTDNFKNITKLVPYKEIAKKKALEYYHANKEAINQRRKERYKQLSIEDKQKLLEYNRCWFNNQSPERQLELREKARKYHKDRYNNKMVEVSCN